MKRNRLIAFMLCLILALSLTACGSKPQTPQGQSNPSRGSSAAQKTEEELLNEENEILAKHNELWEKVFTSMDKVVTDDILSSNYGEFLLHAVESIKDDFTDEEYQQLKADAERIRDIENEMASAGAGAGDESAGGTAAANVFPRFEGKDLDGNAVDSSLFSNNAFTVVNFWFSGCKPCVAELGELDALNERIKEQGGEVIGVNTETLDGNEKNIATAKEILETTGAKYRNIYFDASSEAGKFALGIMAFPTTYVVDRSGNIVGEPLLGGIDNEENMAKLQQTIDEALAKDSGK